MVLGAQRFAGKPLLQPRYSFRDIPWCTKNLEGSTLSEVTDRQHFVDSTAELVLLCNEATRRKNQSLHRAGNDQNDAVSIVKRNPSTKPLSLEYIFDRIDTDDPIWGFMVRTDKSIATEGRGSPSTSPQWRRGMLQGFIIVTTFTNWQSKFRFDSLHDVAFAYDDDDLKAEVMDGIRKYDRNGLLAEALEATVHGGDPWEEGIVYPRIAEISLFGGLGCGKQLLRLVIERLERAKASASKNYDYLILQATENSVPFYESMGFVRVGCISVNEPSPAGYCSSPVDTYVTEKNGETPTKIAAKFDVNVWDIIFLNKPQYGEILPKSWLKKGTQILVPSSAVSAHATSNAIKFKKLGGSFKDTSFAPKWYTSKENETPRDIAKRFRANLSELLKTNKPRYPDLVANSRLMSGTRIQVSRFDIDELHYIPYCHWTFPDDEFDSDEPSYMMAMKLDRKRGSDARLNPVADSFAVPINPYSPESLGAKELLMQTINPLTVKKQKKSTKNDPSKPKRPDSPFTLFSSETRLAMKDKLKGKSSGERRQIIAKKWESLTGDDKKQYIDRHKELNEAYTEALKAYKKNKSCSDQSNDDLQTTKIDTSLLEQVVKLKSKAAASDFESDFKYYYVLTFIPDLQWVHLIPMRKVGVFGPEYPEANGRPIWMIVGEDEGKEIDASAALFQPVKSQTMKNSPDADDEQWDIFETGDSRPLAPIFLRNCPKPTDTAAGNQSVTTCNGKEEPILADVPSSHRSEVAQDGPAANARNPLAQCNGNIRPCPVSSHLEKKPTGPIHPLMSPPPVSSAVSEPTVSVDSSRQNGRLNASYPPQGASFQTYKTPDYELAPSSRDKFVTAPSAPPSDHTAMRQDSNTSFSIPREGTKSKQALHTVMRCKPQPEPQQTSMASYSSHHYGANNSWAAAASMPPKIQGKHETTNKATSTRLSSKISGEPRLNKTPSHPLPNSERNFQQHLITSTSPNYSRGLPHVAIAPKPSAFGRGDYRQTSSAHTLMRNTESQQAYYSMKSNQQFFAFPFENQRMYHNFGYHPAQLPNDKTKGNIPLPNNLNRSSRFYDPYGHGATVDMGYAQSVPFSNQGKPPKPIYASQPSSYDNEKRSSSPLKKPNASLPRSAELTDFNGSAVHSASPALQNTSFAPVKSQAPNASSHNPSHLSHFGSKDIPLSRRKSNKLPRKRKSNANGTSSSGTMPIVSDDAGSETSIELNDQSKKRAKIND